MGERRATIKTGKKLFFKHWLNLIKPFHKLTKQEIDVMSLFLYYHDKFKKETTNKRMLWKFVFDYETKMLIKKELNMEDQGLQNTLTKLRKKKVVINNTINAAYIPDLRKNDKSFKIVFNLLINGEEVKKKD